MVYQYSVGLLINHFFLMGWTIKKASTKPFLVDYPLIIFVFSWTNPTVMKPIKWIYQKWFSYGGFIH